MITDYPPFYDGELLSSYIYRYHTYAGYSNFSDTALEMWGQRGRWVASILFPANANSIIKQLGISADNYINHHTILKYYKAFLQDDQCKRIENEMLYSSCVHISMLKKNICFDYDNSFFNYCPNCNHENDDMLIIKREHQIPGVCVCPLHNCFLEKFIIKNRRERINFTDINLENKIKFNNNKVYAGVSKSILYIFNKDIKFEYPELMYLKNALIDEGIISKGGRVRIGKEILFKKEFDDEPEMYRKIIWPCSLEQLFNLSSYSVINPLVYILIINKLFGDIECFCNNVCSAIKDNS